MRHKAIYATHPNVVSVSDLDGAYDADGNKVEVDEDLVQTKIAEFQADYDSKQYQRDRQPEYPAIADQLDMLFHAIDAGALDKNSDFYTTLKAVKDKYPKG